MELHAKLQSKLPFFLRGIFLKIPIGKWTITNQKLDMRNFSHILIEINEIDVFICLSFKPFLVQFFQKMSFLEKYFKLNVV